MLEDDKKNERKLFATHKSVDRIRTGDVLYASKKKIK